MYYHAVLGCCSEAIINGPLTSEGLEATVHILYTNETHPAVVRCQVTCLNHSRFYSPAMALVITSKEQFRIIPAGNISSWDGLYDIHFNGTSSCEAHNNYTMEFEYHIYSNSSNIDRTVLQCGVHTNHFSNRPAYNILCLGQLYGIIRYDNYETMPTTSSPVMPLITADIWPQTNFKLLKNSSHFQIVYLLLYHMWDLNNMVIHNCYRVSWSLDHLIISWPQK